MERMTRNDLGCMMHTALRKYCDSGITSVAYNLAHSANLEWSLFLDILHKELSDSNHQKTLAIEAQTIVKQIAEFDLMPDNEIFAKWNEQGKPDRCLFTALYCTFKLFNEDDWLFCMALCT